MQDAVVQLIEEQISLQEPSKLRGNAVPAALLRSSTTCHTQLPQQNTLEVGLLQQDPATLLPM